MCDKILCFQSYMPARTINVSQKTLSQQISLIPLSTGATQSVSLNDQSSALVMLKLPYLTLHGSCSTGTGTMTVMVSHDNVTYFESGNIINCTAGSNFYGEFRISTHYCKIRFDQAMTGLTLIAASNQ